MATDNNDEDLSSAFSECNSDRSGEFSSSSQNRRLLIACASSDSLINQLVFDLQQSCSIEKQRLAVMEIRLLAKNKPENRLKIANSGAIKPLITLISSSDEQLQENGVTAILNLSLCDENKDEIARLGAIPPLVLVIKSGTPTAKENAACALLRLSQIDHHKLSIGRSGAIPVLVNLLQYGGFRGKKDACTALYSICLAKENKIRAVEAGIMKPLVELMADFGSGMVDKSAFVLSILVTIPEAKTALVQEGGIPVLVEMVEVGLQRQKEIAAAILLQVCEETLVYRAMVAREGAIPPLVALSQSGTTKAKQKAEALIDLLRQPRSMNRAANVAHVQDMCLLMQNLTMSLEDGEYDGTGDEEGSESDYSECHVSQLCFISDKKQKNDFEEVVKVSIEPPPPLSQNYEARDFRHLTQPDGKCHLSTSARVGFKCRSVLVKLREIYVILIEVPHLKQRLKAIDLMSVFDCKIENRDNQVILAMIERWWQTTNTFYLPCGELWITPRDFTVLTGIGIGTGKPMEFDELFTDYGNAIRVFPDMMPTYYERDALVLLTSELTLTIPDWARLELLCPIVILENKAYTIDFGSAILGDLYYCLDQASKQKYHCYEYCQIGHHILIDNRLDDFWPRISAWQTKRRKIMGNKAKHHLALMRQQLDLRTINNMQLDLFKNMKDTLKREVIIADNINRKRVLLQCSFGGYEWYLGDRCWAQLEHRAVSYDLPEKLYCFSSSDVVRSLRAAGWIEAQHYIVGHHVDYDAYWRHVSHGALMSDIARCGNIDIPGLGALTNGVTFPHVEFPTTDFSTQETQILSPRLGDCPRWIMELRSPYRTTWHTIPSIASTSTIDVPTRYDFFAMTEGDLRHAEGRLSQLNDYLDGEGIVVDWEDDEGEAGTSQAVTLRGRGSRGRGSRGRTYEGGADSPRRSR
ncbi:hypothetical protein GIB67_010786, partial [Kingdonia uniflora]